MAVQPGRPALRLLSGPAACMGHQLVRLHGAGNQSTTHRGGGVRRLWSRRVSWPTPRSESGEARAGRRLVVRGEDLSCEVETGGARRKLVGGGPSSRELVGDAPNWSGV
jgi:hypothetical protein